jgi:hypothetical protein
VVSVIDTAPTSKIKYLCEGFYPIEAHNLMHAASLFASSWRGGAMARMRNALGWTWTVT